MYMTRFFVDPSVLDESIIYLTDDNAAHARVLRLRTNEEVLVCDGAGRECLCTVDICNSSEVKLCVKQILNSEAEAQIKASIYMAFPKGDKLEHVIQKATELGAYEIITFPSARCISKPDAKSLSKKLERWQKIAASAAEQSGRGIIPQVVVLHSYHEALKRAATTDLAILFYENEQATTLHTALESSRFRSVSLLTGPEGGLEESEVDQAKAAGLAVCTLGKRILRCETAPLCALSAVMYAAGEF